MAIVTFASTKPIQVPQAVEIRLTAGNICVTGPLGSLQQLIDTENVQVTFESDLIQFSAIKSTKHAKRLLAH
jgi:ribosomal protein L6P/L9E